MRRARILIAISGSALLWGPLYFALFTWLRLGLLRIGAVVSTLAILAIPFLLRATGSILASANALAAALFLVITFYAVQMGGLMAPGSLWFCALPVIGFALAGWRSGLVWSVAVVLEIVALHFAGKAGLLATSNLEPELLSLLGMASDVGLVFVVTLFTLFYELEKSRALQELSIAGRAKDEFLANMSHEIRTPMNGVLGMAALLRRSRLGEAERRMAQTIHDSAEALLAILDDILDFSKIEAGRLRIEPEACDLRALVDGAIALFAPAARDKGIRLEATIDPQLPEGVWVDPVRLRQVLVNLVGNAVKFTEVGKVEVRLQQAARTEEGLRLRAEVLDTGVGIATEQLRRIFDGFAQADSSTTRRFGGSGLGLTISSRLVGLMGGRMGVESRVGEGSTFWFELPTRAERLSPSVEWMPPEDERGTRVLVADDNPVNLEVLVAMLESLGCEVGVAENGRQVLERLRPGWHELLLLDCQMPELEGYQIAAEIREAERRDPDRARLPIVAITAGALDEDRRRCLEAGMDDHVSKPLGLQQLVDVLERWATARVG